MESSEDDAGAAASAPRRAAAREKDIGVEKSNATGSSSLETTEARTSCQTPAMSEENFDGDSVPSPSSHDANTSTEAILDMIDEIVDGPGAPKRLPHSIVAASESITLTSKNSELPVTISEDNAVHPTVESLDITANQSGQEPDESSSNQAESGTCDTAVSVGELAEVGSPQPSVPVAEIESDTKSITAEGSSNESAKPGSFSECSTPNIPTSSVAETEQSIVNVSECQSQDRTVKCVTSTDDRNNVTVVGSAESTSSDSSVCDGNVQIQEATTRSPLRRRLVRPAPSDRRPDSTVSSTSTSDEHVSEQLNSEVKDVSSSSDAVPTVHGIVNEEIRNLSEISVCKAETSVNPPKKIKLVRQKISPAIHKENVQDKPMLLPEEQCQSTSAEIVKPIASEPHPQVSESTSATSSDDHQTKSDCNQEVMNEISIEIPRSECRKEDKQKIEEEASSAGQGALILASNLNDKNETSTVEKNLDSCLPKQPESKVTGADIIECISGKSDSLTQEQPEVIKQVPKLTIKLSSKQSEELKSPVPKLTIKPLKPPAVDTEADNLEQIPSISKLNIKPIPKPPQVNDISTRSSGKNESRTDSDEQIPLVTKINIKPIPKPPEKINDIHRKSSSSEISESENSENDDTSTSDQASASDQGPTDVVPKVTIKLGKPGSESEGKFYTEKNIPKLTIKGLHNEKEDSERNIPKLTIKNINTLHIEKEDPDKVIPKLTIKGIHHCEKEDSDSSKLKVIISQSEEKQSEKIPKLTIKTVAKCEGQPLSPKLTIKPIKPPPDSKDTVSDVQPIPKLKISTDSISSIAEVKENAHVPKITIKPVTRSDVESKTPKTSPVSCDSAEHIPVVTKLNIKPILKPTESGESSKNLEEKFPVVSKLHIKPLVKPKDNEVDSSVEDIPKITKLNIKPIKCPEETSSDEKDCDELNADVEENSIPIVTKINIKPIIKPEDEDAAKDSENQSSETGNSSDDNADHIPVVTKLNIKPILKPNDLENVPKHKSSNDQAAIPIVTKLNIKPLVKPEDNASPSSPKRDTMKGSDSRTSNIPLVTKLNIKPVVKPDDSSSQVTKDESEEKSVKNPPLVMKINMKAMADTASNESVCLDKKINNIDGDREHIFNNISEEISKPNLKLTLKSGNDDLERISSDNSKIDRVSDKDEDIEIVEKTADIKSNLEPTLKQNCVPETAEIDKNEKSDCHRELPSCSMTKTSELKDTSITELNKSQEKSQVSQVSNSTLPQELENKPDKVEETKTNDNKTNQKSTEKSEDSEITSEVAETLNISKYQIPSVQNCTLLKKLLQTTDVSLDKRLEEPEEGSNRSPSPSLLSQETVNCLQEETEQVDIDKMNVGTNHDNKRRSPERASDSVVSPLAIKIRPIQEICKEASENLKNPLEINISEKVNQSSGQDSPRIILKINKTDHGASAKIITEESCKPDTEQQKSENTQEVNDKTPKRNLINSRRKLDTPVSQGAPVGKRLRSSRIVESADKSPSVRRNAGKRPPPTEPSPPQSKEPELSVLETKRLKLGQLLSNKSLTITPVRNQETPINKSVDNKQDIKGKTVNHNLLNNENCSKNGNSKLHNILSNLQASQIQVNAINCKEKNETVTIEVDSNISSGSGDCEIVRVENCHPEVQEMMINENFEFPNFGNSSDDVSQDPLEVDSSKLSEEVEVPKCVEMTPQPKKRGRPRKIPLSEGAKPMPAPVVALPIPALEERPQRSLRLSRERPAIIAKPRGGRGRGRGARRPDVTPPDPPPQDPQCPDPQPIDPTSSRIKLPRMTEALDKSVCSTPLSSRRHSETTDLKLFGETQVVLDDSLPKDESFMKSPESLGRGGRGARARGAKVRGLKRGGRGRGGGRGAMYMKETLGIYGRVCGPATTTVQLFEEETCMMDDNATPAKPSSCLLDEDSQSSVKSSTNESSKMKKSKFGDLFDSNKIWTAADVKEYTWPQPGEGDEEPQVMMIQEQVSMFLGVKSFKRRYPSLKRRAIGGAEREHVLSQMLVSQDLCDIGITAVDASEVLDIMLSDYPHKYEEFRCHQRQKQIEEQNNEERVEKVEMKVEAKPEVKPEPKADPEKTRQDMALAAIASASEWNSRINALRRPACVDLQTLTVQRRLTPATPRTVPQVRPPCGFYPHALLPGQYQHTYRVYTPDQLRYFPLNTALAAPPAPPDSSSESEPDSDSSLDSDAPTHHLHKRKLLTKVKRSSNETKDTAEESRDAAETELCRVCKLRLEANRKYTHERFLVCADCNAKLHPGCVDLGADTIRKCREYAWQCATCKTCSVCRSQDQKMMFCDLCDRGFHPHCLGKEKLPSGRWHCAECAICKSCGARSPSGRSPAPSPSPSPSPSPAPAPAEWHHQTKRGPGGHKVYSHSLCTPCARAYRIGRYCPLCERSFVGPKGTMQLVICKLCDRQHHQDCVKPTVARLNVLDYTCAECRRGGITSRAAAVRLAPRTIATLFMAKRRFNKYAHRQYLQSRLRAKSELESQEPELELEPSDDTDSRETTERSEDFER